MCFRTNSVTPQIHKSVPKDMYHQVQISGKDTSLVEVLVATLAAIIRRIGHLRLSRRVDLRPLLAGRQAVRRGRLLLPR